jgi:cell division protein FtsX
MRHGAREVRRQLRESGATGLVAVLLVAVATTWGGALWLVRGWVTDTLLARGRPATVVAAVRSSGAATTVCDALTGSFPDVRCATSPPEDTKEELARWFPELSSVLLGLDAASFPALLHAEVPVAEAARVSGWLRARGEVTLVENSRDWQGRLEQALSSVLLIGFTLTVALLAGCGVVVLLVVRLLVLEHNDEIAIMRLIGAREREIRLPYLACGALLGLVGGALGVALLLAIAVLMTSHGIAVRGVTPLMTLAPLLGATVGALGATLGLASLPEEP